MNVKTDTKEKFTVITPEEKYLSVNMTEEIRTMLLQFLQKDIPHLVLNMTNVEIIDDTAGELLAAVQQQFYDQNCSFVICELQKNVEDKLDKQELLEVMNVTPTESEAWDVLQMEEIEREFLEDEP